jgi:hypothetical protein
MLVPLADSYAFIDQLGFHREAQVRFARLLAAS